MKNFELINTERYEGGKVEIYEHATLGEDFGFLIAKVGKRYYKIGIDGFDRNDFKNGYYKEIKSLREGGYNWIK